MWQQKQSQEMKIQLLEKKFSLALQNILKRYPDIKFSNHILKYFKN